MFERCEANINIFSKNFITTANTSTYDKVTLKWLFSIHLWNAFMEYVHISRLLHAFPLLMCTLYIVFLVGSLDWVTFRGPTVKWVEGAVLVEWPCELYHFLIFPCLDFGLMYFKSLFFLQFFPHKPFHSRGLPSQSFDLVLTETARLSWLKHFSLGFYRPVIRLQYVLKVMFS